MNKETFLLEKPNKNFNGFFLINTGAFEKCRMVLDSQSDLSNYFTFNLSRVCSSLPMAGRVKLDGL